MDDKLKPCPFCGGVAQRVDIPADEHDPNAGGSYIACQFCLASSSIAFGDKSSLVDNWNSRAGDARIRAEARAEALKEAADRAVSWLINNAANTGIAPPVGEEKAIYRVTSLRAAILADEPKENKCPTCKGTGRILESDRDYIKGDKCPRCSGGTAPIFIDEPKEERGAEGPCCKCVEEKGAPPCEFCGPPAWEAFQERESSWEPMVRALIGLLPRRERRWLKGVVDAEVERRIEEAGR